MLCEKAKQDGIKRRVGMITFAVLPLVACLNILYLSS